MYQMQSLEPRGDRDPVLTEGAASLEGPVPSGNFPSPSASTSGLEIHRDQAGGQIFGQDAGSLGVEPNRRREWNRRLKIKQRLESARR